jgi:5'-3' exonuclease
LTGEVKVDREGKKNDWEFVVCVPLPAAGRVREAMSAVDESKLTDEEKSRNSSGKIFIFSVSLSLLCSIENLCFQRNENINKQVNSTLPSIYPDVINCHTECNSIQTFEEWK